MKLSLIGFMTYCSALQIHSTCGQSTRCVNPNKRSGSCVSIYDCQTLMSVLEREPLEQDGVDFVKASFCFGSYGRAPHVCCASDTGFTPKTVAPTSINTRLVFPEDNYSNNPFFENFSSSSRRDSNYRRGFEGRRQRFAAGRSENSRSTLPQPPACGGVSIENKIYGGTDTEPNEFPWMVLLEYNRRAGGVSFNCGGSLVNSRYILTAAHCVKGSIERQIGPLVAVRLGEHDLISAANCNYQNCAATTIRAGIDEIVAHESYKDNSPNKVHDIALVRLDRNIRFSDQVRPICLPSVVREEQQQPGTKFTVAGWGRTLRGPRSAISQKINVALTEQEQCKRKFFGLKVNIVDTQLCAGGTFAEDSCEGDSGGPLMRFRGGAWVLEGIVSFGHKCGLKDWPAVYTRVASYDAWIKSNMRA